MTPEETKAGIQQALLRFSIVRPQPDDDQGHADWIEWTTEWLDAFFRRARMPKMKLDAAIHHANKEVRKKLRDSVYARYLDIELPPLPESEEPTNETMEAVDDDLGADFVQRNGSDD